MDFVTLGSQKGCMPMLNFFYKKILAILEAKNKVYTFSNPAPEVSPVLTLGICCKGQERTRVGCAGHYFGATLLKGRGELAVLARRDWLMLAVNPEI